MARPSSAQLRATQEAEDEDRRRREWISKYCLEVNKKIVLMANIYGFHYMNSMMLLNNHRYKCSSFSLIQMIKLICVVK